MLVATCFSQTYIERNTTGHIHRTVSTTNNTATQVDAITVLPDEVGYFTVNVLGMVSDTSGNVQGTLRYKYQKTSAGTLTLTGTDTVQAVTTGVNCTGALFAASAVSNNIVIKVTGVSSHTIRWSVITKQWLRRNDH